MTIRGPWYISVAAVRDYLWITGQSDATDGPIFEGAEQALIEQAIATMASQRSPAILASGALRYRGPKPRRLSLIISASPLGAGDRPALIAVQAEHATRTSLAPHRQRDSNRT